MSDRILVGTRKGLFTITRASDGAWGVDCAAFLGDHVSMVLPDHRDGVMYAGLAHGHFGAKLHRSRDGGVSWEECATPAYPQRAEGEPPDVSAFGTEIPWKLSLIWALRGRWKR